MSSPFFVNREFSWFISGLVCQNRLSTTWIDNYIPPNARDVITFANAWIPRLSNKFHFSDDHAPVIDINGLKQLILGVFNSFAYEKCVYINWKIWLWNMHRWNFLVEFPATNAYDVFFCILLKINQDPLTSHWPFLIGSRIRQCVNEGNAFNQKYSLVVQSHLG